ncbi:OmpA family protein [Roseivirga sp. BDSF3-8]|uniref:OmpA family protein n=1 Tax=Roseivirga sp. BDSF3-8 TaxID=3241598 RepID=UPI00353189C5
MRKVIFLLFIFLYINTGWAQEIEEGYEEPTHELVKLGLNVNSRFNDSAPLVAPDGSTLYFFIANHPDNKYGVDNSQDIWYCRKDSTGNWSKAVRMEEPLNRNRFNQVMSISLNGNTLLIRGGEKKNSKGFSLTSRKDDGGWSDPVELDIPKYEDMDNGMFSGGFLSYDNEVLLMYFSERAKSKYSDIYASYKQDDGSWSEPEKLGDPINTHMDEFGPFLAPDNKTMYFASNRPGGYGNSDIYKTVRLDDTWKNWSEPENIGEPVNTGGFDAYYTIDAAGETAFTTRAYMSADGGGLDILGLVPIVKEPEPEPVITLSGMVLNAKTDDAVAADVRIDSVSIPYTTVQSDELDGFYETPLPSKGIYYFHIKEEGFIELFDSVAVEEPGEYGLTVMKNLYLTPLEVGVTVRLDRIYFDFDKTVLRPESYPELDRVVSLLMENPTLKIEIAGHTDNKGSDGYNETLSQGRADAVRDYLVQKTFEADRITAVGHGESKPEATNETDEGRQINRRVEFTILSK